MTDEPSRLTAKRAKADPVMGPFIEKAKEEITYHQKFKIESLVKALNLQFYRATLNDHMPRLARIIEKDLNCRLVPFASQDMLGNLTLAGIGAGRRIGYVKVGKEHATLADAANTRRVGQTNGVARVHNAVADILQTETGEARNRLTVQQSKLPPPSTTLRLARSFVEALRDKKE